MNPAIITSKMNIDLVLRKNYDVFKALKRLNEGFAKEDILDEHFDILHSMTLIDDNGKPYPVVSQALAKYFK